MVYVLFIVIALVSFAVQRTLQSKFERYSKIPIPYGLTGRDIAMRMLQENGINDVSVTQVDGHFRITFEFTLQCTLYRKAN